MNKLLSSLIISSVVIAALTVFGSTRQSIAAAHTLFSPIQQDVRLTLSRFEQMLEHGTPDPTIAALIRRNGIAFQPTAEMLARLRRINYSQTLQALEAIRRPAPTPKPKPKDTGKETETKGEVRKPEEPRTDTATDPNTITILVANFSGPDQQNYLVTEKIIQGLRAATSGYSDISVQPLGETITEQTGSKGGSAYARDIGTKRKAGIVLWGYYGVTPEQVDINVYFEVVRAPKNLDLRQNFETHTLLVDELNKFKVQTRLSKEMTYLVLLTVGLARYEAGDYEGAVDRFTKALAPSDASPNVPEQMVAPHRIYLFRGFSHYLKDGEGGLDRAIADYDKSIQIKSDVAEAYLIRGWLYSHKSQHDRAIADFNDAIKLKPNLAEAYFSRGVAYSAKGLHDLAIQEYDQTIKLKPDYFRAYYNRGNDYDQKGLHDRAIADYDKTIELKPDYVEAYNNRGVTYGKMAQYDRAIVDFDKAISINPAHASSYVNRGHAYDLKGQYDRAVADYNKAIELKPDDANTYFGRGSTYIKKGQYDLATADFDKVIELKPDDAKGYYNRGLTYGKRGQYDLAVADYGKAIELQPGFVEPYNNRGIIYARSGQNDLAMADFDKAIELQPDLVEGYVNRAVVFHAKGNLERAIADFKTALSKTSDPNIRRRVEEVLQQLGVK